MMNYSSRRRKPAFRALHTLINAKARDGIDMLQTILEDRSAQQYIEQRDEDGLTPLLLAAKMGCSEAVGLLIFYRASLDAQDNDGFTALHWAIARGHEQVARLLVFNKASIGVVALDGLNELQRAFLDGSPEHANRRMVELLLQYGADPNNPLDLLHQAVRMNNQHLVKVLLNHGASTSGEDKQGRTAVEYSGDQETVDLLIKYALSKRKACGKDLICAANFCRMQSIRRLIAIGIDVNSRDSRGKTALLNVHELADDHFNIPSNDIHDDVEYERRGQELEKTLRILLKAGADPHIPDDDLQTPSNSIQSSSEELGDLYDTFVKSSDREWPTKLHQAIAMGDLDAVQQLLSEEPSASHIDATDSNGFTAMHYAILSGRGDRENIVKHLIEKNANPNVQDVYGCTPLHYAAALRGFSTSLLAKILRAGGSLDTRDRLGRRPVDMAIVHSCRKIHHFLTEVQRIRFQKSHMDSVVDGRFDS